MSKFRKVKLTRLECASENHKKHTAHVTIHRIVNNTAISLVGQVVTWSSTLFLTAAYGRFLGDVKFGELYFALTFVLLIGIPIERGFNQQITRDVAQKPEKALRYLSNTLLIKTVLWLILYTLILLISWLLRYNAETWSLIAICGFTLLTTGIGTTFASSHYALQRVLFPVVGTILEKGLSALFGFFILKYTANVQLMALILLGGSLISAIWQAIWFFHLVGAKFIVDRRTIRELIRSGIPFLAYGVMGVLYYRLDTILLSLITDNAVVGWYGAGYRLFDTLVFLPSLVIGTIMYPVFSKFSTTSQANLKLAVEKSMNFLLFVAIPTSTFLIVAAPDIIGFLYHNPQFDHAIPVLQLLAPGLVFLYINSVHGSVIVSTKNEKKSTLMAGIALLFNLTLNLILIPIYQHIGAAVSTSLTEMLLFSMGLFFVPRSLLPVKSLRVGAKVLIASLIMAVVTWPLHYLHNNLHILLLLPIAMVVYIGSALLIGAIPHEDLSALYKAIQYKTQRKQSSENTLSTEAA